MDFNLRDKFEFRDMTKNERKAFLAFHEIKISELALKHRVKQPAVTGAISGNKDLRKLLGRISASLYKRMNKKACQE